MRDQDNKNKYADEFERIGCNNSPLYMGIEYGDARGNETTIFLVPGWKGSLYGENNKYFIMSKRLAEKYGVNVVCSSNPGTRSYDDYCDEDVLLHEYYEVIKEKLPHTKKIRVMANSAGALEVLYYSTDTDKDTGNLKYKNIEKIVFVNMPISVRTLHKIYDAIDRIIASTTIEEVVFVYGEFDGSVDRVSLIKEYIADFGGDKIKIKIVPFADHKFSLTPGTFMTIPENYLLGGE